ncbi:hypothetical protein GALMADRAFT_159509 [Galerina marginata CBS 339.88]|uniref:F-box domain-containing protein n=1 Tax=Galerina marginata (strain CBS 339.88) TaxID=685588 RepID=A0A067SWZ9_GALM3|nr:hypothetical protein GALMADRAFT_159509 [Galerina marginata CBS 339.88]
MCEESSVAHPICTSAISQLDEDVLGRIFEINADLGIRSENFHPLDVTRRASQVCRQWRQLIIDSPSIWGGLIDLDHFSSQKTDHWRDEVMTRTGQSLLSVTGSVQPDDEATRDFFHSLMTFHWPRIRTLELSVFADFIDSSAWDIFWEEPALHLEKFILQHHRNAGSIVRHSGDRRSLFANQAPSLRSFHCRVLDFDNRAGWISQLRSVTLSFPLSVFDALDLLSRAPHLQEVTIGGRVALPPTPLPPQNRNIVLPYLHHIKFENSLRNSVTFLEQMVPAPQCQLDLVTTDYGNSNISFSDITSLNLVASRFAKSFFNSTDVIGLMIIMTSQSFLALPTFLDKHRNLITTTPPFRMHITCYPKFPQGSASLLLGTFSACRLISITNLDLLLDTSCNLGAEDPVLAEMIMALTSVKELTINAYGVELLNVIPFNNAVMFPSLRTVNLQYMYRATPTLPETLLSFLERRKKAGVAVDVVDISRWSSTGKVDWSFLEAVEGLRVVLKSNGETDNYICGTGRPERLNFLTTVES